MKDAYKPSFCTTGQFATVGGGYAKHCGPTAITNLILTLRPDLQTQAADVFRTVARLGTGRGLYWNLEKSKWVGGTSDALVGTYIRMALRLYGLDGHPVRFAGPALPGRVAKALEEGRIVFLELHFHPTYRNHQLLVYGYDDRGFLAADGWSARPVYLGRQDLKRGLFLTIS
jgi:hypothetical protein